MGKSCRLKLRVVESNDDFGSLKSEWERILSKYKNYPPFLTWEWMYTWWQTYKTEKTRLFIFVIHLDSHVVGIAPFYIRQGYFPFFHKTIYLLGTGEPERKEVCSEYLDFISINEYSKEVCEKVATYLATEHKDWNQIKFQRILNSSSLVGLFVTVFDRYSMTVFKNTCGLRYFIELPTKWDEYLASLKSSMRRSIIVARRKFKAQQNVSVDIISREDEIIPTLLMLKKLHTQSWKLKGKLGAFSSQEFCQFHQTIAKNLYKKNMLYLSKICLNNEVVAILYNFKIKETVYYYQSGFNIKKYASISPGVLAHSMAIEHAISEKLKSYDFMMSKNNTYKYKYNCKTTEMLNISVFNVGLRSKFFEKLALLPYL